MKKDLVPLCDHCMGPMNLEWFEIERDKFAAHYCKLDFRMYTAAGGYRHHPTPQDPKKQKLFLVRCMQHTEAPVLYVVGFASEGRMKLVCPIEACNTSREEELSKEFSKG